MPVKVLVIEDHESMRNGLTFIVESSDKYECVGAVATAEAGLKFVRENQPGIILMDINLPGKSGIECTSIIKSEFPDIQILICTVSEDSERIFKALAAGASGYLLKKSTPQQILEAMNDLVLGGSPISSSVARKMVDFFQQNTHQSDLPENLTNRELEILNMLSQGFRNKEIGDKLFISLPTVKSHIYNIYQKLHVQSRIAAVNLYNNMKVSKNQ
jgi:DNA-binding NarL/FixJ family response regulator